MKRPIAIIGVGIVLLFGLSVVVSGERVVSDSKKPVKVEKKTQPKGTAGADVGSAAADRPQSLGITEQEPIVSETAISPNTDYQIRWQSINAGGDDRSSVSYRVLFSVGQAVSGYGTSDNYQAGMGFWYGASGAACDCGTWGDVTGDGNVNPVDVVFMVNKVYLGNDMIVQHPNCPRDAGDVNCDGNVNPVDVVFFVNRVYLGNDMFCADPCS